MNLNKIKSTLAQSKAFGHACSKMSRDLDVSIIKIPDKRYGSVNSYHIDILKKFFSKVKNINK